MKVINKPIKRTILSLCLVVAFGCEPVDDPFVEERVAETSSELSDGTPTKWDDGDIPSRPPVELSWGLNTGADAIAKTDSFEVTLTNLREEDVSVELSMFGMGLDQRTSTAPIGQYTLTGLETRVVDIALDALPIQSIGAPGQIDLVGSCTGPTWNDIQLPAASLYVQYAPGYSKVFASTGSTWSPVALSLVDGDKSDPEYARLRDNPSELVRTETSSFGPMAVDNTKRTQMFDKVMLPAQHPEGRVLDAYTVGFVYVSSTATVGGGMLPMETTQVELMDELLQVEIAEVGYSAQATRLLSAFFAPSPPYYVPIPKQPFPIPKPLLTKKLRMCGQWGVRYIDSGLGEDYLNGVGYQRYPARYATAQIRQITPVQMDHWSGQLDAEGCAPEIKLPYGTYYLAISSNVKTPDNTLFRITGDEDKQQWSWWLGFRVCHSEPFMTTLTTSNDGASRIGAVVSLLISNWDSGIMPNKKYQLINSTTDCGGVGAYAGRSVICYGNDPNGGAHTTTSKVTIAHEIGHSIDSEGAGMQGIDYSWQVTNNSSCRCDHVKYANKIHCLQSWETASAALLEGFAQFYAAKVFNEWRHSDCSFAYYKEFLQDNGVVLTPPVSLSCKIPHRWMKNHCDVTGHNGGVEMDWMTFFWNIHAPQEYGDQRISMADYYNIKKISCTGDVNLWCRYIHNLDFQKFRNGALTYFNNQYFDKRYQHIIWMGDNHGVRNGLQ